MSNQNELKRVKEIFSDYKTQSNIHKALIEKMSLTKKKNILEIELQSSTYLEIKEIWYFESYLKERFKLEQINIIIKYAEEVDINDIEKEWKNINCKKQHQNLQDHGHFM